ncbi:SDR family oxidoreductase [Catalinimonas alkaloidigena]|uniref:SDR family oxidoreductase n=1 Tax=Catalinimonas alkaloidigena TaxID=1075417 RepID=UPI0024064886|nr:SDR family oxidoreductase [Catalinimonas alkaloidigena]
MAKPDKVPEQGQKKQPGKEHQMHPEPEIIRKGYKGGDRLKGKVALITGGDSGIGRAVAVHFAHEGADIAIIYKSEDQDAEKTKRMVEEANRKCLVIRGDLKDHSFSEKAVSQSLKEYKKIDILVNNAAVQFPKDMLEEISDEQLEKTFDTNILAMIRMTRALIPHLKEDARIINTTSVTAYRGSAHLMDYASTKGAIVSFTRSLAKNLAEKKILANGVAPGPIWTPLIPATFDDVSKFGQNTPLGRPGQPSEVAPAYVFLASEDATYMTGQIIHINGGEVIGG